MKAKELHLKKLNTIDELNENNNNNSKIPIQTNNRNSIQDSHIPPIPAEKRQNTQITYQKILNNPNNNNNNSSKDPKEPTISNQKKKSVYLKDNMFLSTLGALASTNIKNLDENKSIYSTSKKGESSVYGKFNKNKNNPNNEKSAFGDSFDLGKQSQKEIMESASKEAQMFNLIDDTINFLNGDKFYTSNTKEEKDKYEMIEKNKFQKMKENNLEFKQKKIQLTEKYNNLVKHVNQVSQGIIGLKKTYNEQEKNKDDTKNQIYYEENELKELKIHNEKIHEMVLDNRMKKNNFVRALVKVCKKHQEKIPKSKKKLFEAFYNQNFEDFLQLKNFEKIKSLKEKIALIEEEVKAKNKECQNVKSILEKK